MGVLVITGTGTGVGKTIATAALASAARTGGVDVTVCKPVQTGSDDGEDDLVEVARLAGVTDLVSVARYPEPLAPAAAAQRCGRPLPAAAEILAAVHAADRPGRLTLVEGAGGLLVPLAGRATFADLAARCRLPLLVVVGNRLGCVNHACLTMRWARHAGLAVTGYVINTLQPDADLAMATNVDLLHEILGPSLGVFPWVGEPACTEAERERLADLAERSLRIDALLE